MIVLTPSSAILRAGAAVSALQCLLAYPVLGQPGSPVSGAVEGALEEVIVTARKRPENLQDVAIAVSAFSADELEDAGVGDAMQLQTVVPSLTYVTTGFIAQPYLRGVGTRLSPVGMEASVATYIDDRYVPRPFAAVFDMLDLERVEVLKGPQGTLHGRNAAGGAIRAITREPFAEPTVELSGTLGNYDAARIRLAAGGPLTTAIRAQLAIGRERREGFASNLAAGGRRSADDVDREALRARLVWDVNDAVTARFGLSWFRFRDWSGGDLTAVGPPEANRGVVLYGGITSRDREYFATTMNDDNDIREGALDLRFDATLTALSLVSITTYTDSSFRQILDIDASDVSLSDVVVVEPGKTLSQELRLHSPAGADVEWTAGIYLYEQRASNVYTLVDTVSAQPQFPAGTDVSNGLQEVDSESYALFAEAAPGFGERWTLSIGGRLSRESKSVTLTAVPDAVTNVPVPYADATSWDEFTPRVAIEYRGNFGLAYLSYSRGFKSGGYNYPASLGSVLDPETVDSYELGLKTELWADRLRVNSALFTYDFRDLQVTRGGAGAFLRTENAANAGVTGLETEIDLGVTSNLTLGVGVALIDSEYESYTAGVLVPQFVAPYGNVPLAGGLDVRGRPLLRSPERAARLGLAYARDVTTGRLALDFRYAWKDDYYFDFAAVPENEWLRQAAYGVVNARLAYAHRRADWEVALWATNLSDEVYYEDAVLNSASSRVSYADPRTFGLDFRVRL